MQCLQPLLPSLTPPTKYPGGEQQGEEGETRGAAFGGLRPSLVFAGPCLAVASDGLGELAVLDTGDRNPVAHHTWQVRPAMPGSLT